MAITTTIELTPRQRRMLLEAAISFRQADKDFIQSEGLHDLSPDVLELWDNIISQLKKRTYEARNHKTK